MYIFHYDLQGRYLGSDPCEFDQLEPGRVIVPAWATAKPVIPMKDGFERVFDVSQDRWIYVKEESK